MLRIMIPCFAAVVLAACQPAVEPSPSAEPATAEAPAMPTADDPVWVAEQNRYLAVNVTPSDPLEALMWRGVRCDFLGSEIGGDNSAQDRAIQTRMDELRCGDDLMADTRALRQARAADPAAVARLDALIARW